MAIISDQGITATTRNDYLTLLNTQFRAALGSDLDLSTPTPQGQLIGVLAETFSDIDQAIVATANGFALSAATGRQLDDLASLFGLRRSGATRSEVTATLSGVAGTAIPSGSLAATTAGITFATTQAATIGAGGSVDVLMRASDAGELAAVAGTLTRVLTRISGWDSVTNAANATLGREVETDSALRGRYRAILGRNARTSLSALESSIADTDGVTAYRVTQNNTAINVTVQNIAIEANSILAIVEGGTDAAVASTIAGAKALGVGTSGDQSAVVQGNTIRFRRPEEIPIRVTLQTNTRGNFQANGIQQITATLINYISDLSIGYGLGANELYAPAYRIPNHTISSIVVARKSGSEGVATADIDLDQKLTLATGDVTITVTT